MSLPNQLWQDGLLLAEHADFSKDHNRNSNLISMKEKWLGFGWTGTRVLPKTTFTISLPIVLTAGAFDLIIKSFQGYALRIFALDDGDVDPSGTIITGDDIPGVFSIVRVVPSSKFNTQNQTILSLVDVINSLDPPWTATAIEPLDLPDTDFDGVYSKLEIVFDLPGLADGISDHVAANGTFFLGNVLGGGAFNGRAYGGGWVMGSSPAPITQSTLGVKFVNTGNVQLTVDMGIDIGGTGGMPPFYIHNRTKISFGVGQWTLMFISDRHESYTPSSIDEVLSGGADYWLTCLRPEESEWGGGDAIMLWASSQRGALNTLGGCACVTPEGSWSYWGEALALIPCTLPDTGISCISLNTNYNSGYPLLTTAGKPILYGCLIAMSPARDAPLRICGYAYNCLLLTKTIELDKQALTDDDAEPTFAMSYRTQQAPSENTLLLCT